LPTSAALTCTCAGDLLSKSSVATNPPYLCKTFIVKDLLDEP